MRILHPQSWRVTVLDRDGAPGVSLVVRTPTQRAWYCLGLYLSRQSFVVEALA